MRARLVTMVCCGLALALSVGRLAAQPKPGPEHEKLKKFAGEWDAAINAGGNQSKGTSSNKVGLGGFWLTTDFVGDFGGMKFEGRGATGYDPMKKKYVSTWVDSMTPSLLVLEGSFDKDDKTYTETGESTGPDGKLAKMKSVYEFKDADSMTFTMYMVADGKDQEMLKINYTRKK